MLLAAYSAYYLLLEPVAGGTWAAAVALPLWGGANAFRAAVPCAWGWALALHALSWLAQVVVGHNLVEGRKPALLDSFFQVRRCWGAPALLLGLAAGAPALPGRQG